MPALGANAFGCPEDPDVAFSCWDPVGVTSIGTGNRTVFANITFASDRPVIPDSATRAMLIAGFGLVGFAARRRRVALAA